MGKHTTKKRVIVARIQREWISEEDLRSSLRFQFLEKLYTPDEMSESIDGLIDLGFLKERYRDGRREFFLDMRAVTKAIAEIPPETRKGPQELKIFEWAGALCDYDRDAAALLSLIAQQTEKTPPPYLGYPVAPWIEKTGEELDLEMIGMVKDIEGAFKKLVDREFVILLPRNESEHFQYSLNVPTVQAAINKIGGQG